MNRELGDVDTIWLGKPHACGDDPDDKGRYVMSTAVNPTHVGMNRINSALIAYKVGKPHACGDEPARTWKFLLLKL